MLRSVRYTPRMDVAVLVPRRAGIEDRDRLWSFARAWWEHDHPDWRIVEGHHNVGPFNRGAALNTAARNAGAWDVAVIIDSDVLIDPQPVRSAVELAAQSNRMVLGFHDRVHLSPHGTEKVLNGFRGNWENRGMVKRRFRDSCSSCVVVNRALWDRVGGFDERFDGWGWEDVAFRVACETLGDGDMIKMAGTLYHLWHRTSHENNPREITFQRNKMRGEAYREARFNVDAVERLLREEAEYETPELESSRIPRILHRTVPQVSRESDAWWAHWQQLLPGWELMTHRDPMDPNAWPETGDLWEKCANGAQRAGLIRLEALWTHGGVYVDSDVEPYRSLEPLVHTMGFAAWEDARCIPDAVMGFQPAHPAVRQMISDARAVIEDGGDAWHSGPGVSTAVLQGRRDVLLLPPGTFYPYHYTEKARRGEAHMTEQPWCFAAHHWNGSWLSPEQQRAQRRRERTA